MKQIANAEENVRARRRRGRTRPIGFIEENKKIPELKQIRNEKFEMCAGLACRIMLAELQINGIVTKHGWFPSGGAFI